MILPEADQAAQQIGPPQKGAVVRSGAADHDVIAAAGSGVLPIEHELFCSEAGLARQFIELGCVFDQVVPGLRRAVC